MKTGKLATLAALALVLAAAAEAQQGSAEIRGRVVDQSGASLPGATLELRNQSSGVYRQGYTTADGSYFLTGLTPGVYELTAQMPGFKKYSRKDVRLESAAIDLYSNNDGGVNFTNDYDTAYERGPAD